jgi:hypothetical protein
MGTVRSFSFLPISATPTHWLVSPSLAAAAVSRVDVLSVGTQEQAWLPKAAARRARRWALSA